MVFLNDNPNDPAKHLDSLLFIVDTHNPGTAVNVVSDFCTNIWIVTLNDPGISRMFVQNLVDTVVLVNIWEDFVANLIVMA